MENLLDYVQLLTHFLPPTFLSPLITATSTSWGIARTLESHLRPLYQRILTQPDTTSIILLLVILFISWQVLGMAYRAVMFWVRLAFKAFWMGSLLALGVWVYNRGVDGFVEDVVGLWEFGGAEFDRYSGEVKKFQGQKEAQLRKQQGRAGGRW